MSRLVPDDASQWPRRGHSLGKLGPLAGLLACLGAAISVMVAQAQTATPVPASAVDVQLISARDGIERTESLAVTVVVANRSPLPLTGLAAEVSSDDFHVTAGPTFPAELAPYDTFVGQLSLSPSPTAAFVQYRIPLFVAYTWSPAGQQIRSRQGSFVSVQLKRRFEDEAKGFLGGNAAFLYLLLPIVPFMLGYQFVQQLKDQGLALPTLNAEQVPAMFVLGVVANFGLLAFFRPLQLDYSDPLTSLVVLAIAFGLGVLVAAVAWGWRSWQQQRASRWDFTAHETPITYLHKALQRPNPPEQFVWVCGKASGTPWEGILLPGGDGKVVLGAAFQVSPTDTGPSFHELETTVVSAAGIVHSPAQLIDLLESGRLNLQLVRSVTRGGNAQTSPVALLDGFEQDGEATPQVLVRLTN